MTAKRKKTSPPVIDMAAALPDRILAALTGNDSKHPARSVDIAALVGADEAAYQTALKTLADQRSINCAHVQRKGDSAPWLAIWPTGVRLGMDTWKHLTENGHFAIGSAVAKQQLPESIAKRRQREAAELAASKAGARRTATATARREAIAALVAGKTLANGLTSKALAAEIGMSYQGIDWLITTMTQDKRIARGRVKSQRADRIYDPAAIDATPTAFSVQDGGLAICNGDGLIKIPAADLPRLAQTLAAMGRACGAQA